MFKRVKQLNVVTVTLHNQTLLKQLNVVIVTLHNQTLLKQLNYAAVSPCEL
jgi:hypothetical protein